MMFLLFIRFAFFTMIAIVLGAIVISWYHGQSIGEWIDETVEYFLSKPEKEIEKEEVER